jgi:hypothetical protein
MTTNKVLSRYIGAFCSTGFLKTAKLVHCEGGMYNLYHKVVTSAKTDKFSLYFLYTNNFNSECSKVTLTRLERQRTYPDSTREVENVDLFLEGFEFSITPTYDNLRTIKKEIAKIQDIITRDITFSTLYVSSKAHKLYERKCRIPRSWKRVMLADVEALGNGVYRLFMDLYEFVCFGFDVYKIPSDEGYKFALYSREMNVTFVFDFWTLLDVEVCLTEVRIGLIRFKCFTQLSVIETVFTVLGDMDDILRHHYQVSKYAKGGVWMSEYVAKF